jgi:prepilin-type N-terminal cleavage/methylation domain-containing protein
MDQLIRDRARARAGFTLVEVMIAMVLLAFGLLAMLALQLHAMRGGQVGRHYTGAAQVARDRMELLQRLPWDHADVMPTGGWVADGNVTANVEHETLGQAAEMVYARDYRIVADAAQPLQLRHIDVRVTWYEESDPGPPAPPRRRYAITSVRFDDGS